MMFGWLLVVAIPPACYMVGHYRGRRVGRQEVRDALHLVTRTVKERTWT